MAKPDSLGTWGRVGTGRGPAAPPALPIPESFSPFLTQLSVSSARCLRLEGYKWRELFNTKQLFCCIKLSVSVAEEPVLNANLQTELSGSRREEMRLCVHPEQSISPGPIFFLFTFLSAFPHFPALFLFFGKLFLPMKVPDPPPCAWSLS